MLKWRSGWHNVRLARFTLISKRVAGSVKRHALRPQGAEHAILHDDMERNAMIETINELEKERDELRGGYNAGLLKAIEIAKAQKVGTAEIGDDWGQGQDSMADQIVAALETARGGVTPPPTQPGWKPDSLANETQKLEEK